MTQIHPIRKWRDATATKAVDLAAEVGIAPASLSYIESGRNGCRLSTLRALVEATEKLRPGHGLTAGQILGSEPYEPQDSPAGGNGGNGGSPEQTDTAA